jgi:transcriptional regulator of acetoin/glycerol metabolism
MTKDGLLDRDSYLLGLLDRKPWVGLTSEDMKDEKTHNFDFVNGARWAEEILKERNT